jgi:hypothetical protein
LLIIATTDRSSPYAGGYLDVEFLMSNNHMTQSVLEMLMLWSRAFRADRSSSWTDERGREQN